MAETASFVYEGNVVLSMRSPQEIEIKKIEHMIPSSVICNLNGVETMLTVYIDYSSNKVRLPKETENILHNPDHFKESLLSYIKELQEEQRKQYNSATQTFIKSKIAKFPAPHQEHHG